MKIAIIGFGAAAIGFIEKMKDTGNEIHIFEKGEDFGYTGHCPAISGCHSQRDTLQGQLQFGQFLCYFGRRTIFTSAHTIDKY